MNSKLLQKYIAGNATEAEKKHVTEWLQASSDNMREYMSQRKLFDVTLWHDENKLHQRKRYSYRKTLAEFFKIAA